MNSAQNKILHNAVNEAAESAVRAYGWKLPGALAQAVREVAAEFGVSKKTVIEAWRAEG
jgi:hypothetical protein